MIWGIDGRAEEESPGRDGPFLREGTVAVGRFFKERGRGLDWTLDPFHALQCTRYCISILVLVIVDVLTISFVILLCSERRKIRHLNCLNLDIC